MIRKFLISGYSIVNILQYWVYYPILSVFSNKDNLLPAIIIWIESESLIWTTTLLRYFKIFSCYFYIFFISLKSIFLKYLFKIILS